MENSSPPPNAHQKFTLEVSEEADGLRLDKYLANELQLSDLSRSQIKKIIEDKNILVNGKSCRPSRRLSVGEKIEVTVPPFEAKAIEPEDIDIDIVYEDDDLVVIDKPPGLVVHPGAGKDRGTLISALLFREIPLSRCGPEDRPGIVHRLDKDTSGLIVVAKTDAAHDGLSAQFKAHTTERIYVSLCWGRIGVDNGIIEAPLARHPKDRKRITASRGSGRRAVTEYRVVERFSQITLVELMPKTGRTHQIRVHLAYIGHPVCGDTTYGSMKAARSLSSPMLKKAVLALKRQALHAKVLGFVHPITGERMRFTSDVPADIEEFLKVLRSDG
ncbi:MAG: RluA family pseudouridine synthase [Deltaproteobacteria bacterium]|uniref:Pseudouridine synthase n=1 Tax=Candidatus Zymogenus saltonus TaxID=2844893 RepID=A0A9D8KF85_9DELT|nr:RluA family pseudouridine synthase [Candidatus Zymogenus saltonus]